MSVAEKIKQKFTYQDYLKWGDKERWEIIDGEAYNMSPSPTRKHQKISGNFFFELKKSLKKDKKCEIYEAPMDVILDEFNVVQPDIFVVCNQNMTSDFVDVVPLLVIEIISSGTAYKDTKLKKDLYEKFGVLEYIIVYPDFEIVERYLLKDGKYGAPEVFNWDENLNLKSIDIVIELWEVFEKERE